MLLRQAFATFSGRVLMTLLGCVGVAVGAETSQAPEAVWRSDYATAYREARENAKLLLIYFSDVEHDDACRAFDARTWSDAEVRQRLSGYVCLRLPLDVTVDVDGKPETLLKHGAFREMLGRPGLAIIDLVHKDTAYYGDVVSTFPLTAKLCYTPQQVATILDLPPGTLTQRTLIYAVRVHPDGPASTDGKFCSYLVSEAAGHAQYQADIGVQGHQGWDTRFRRINTQLPDGLTASEVCAESWPGEHLVEGAIECVRCWRLSSGHWSAVRARHRMYGYDMKHGRNGVWYATGIFARG